MVQALDQMLEMVPSSGTQGGATIDVLTSGYSQMDCGPCNYGGCVHDREFYMEREAERRQIPLDGGVYIDIKKTTPNTTIIRQPLSLDTYIHHNRGPGRKD